MNIVIATGIYPPDIGGPATYVPILAQALTDAGHAVTVVTYSHDNIAEIPNTNYQMPNDDNVPWSVIRVSRKGRLWQKAPRYLWTLLQASRGADLIYAQSPTSVGPAAMLVSKLFHIPYVVKIVGDGAWERGRAKGEIDHDLESFTQHNWKETPPGIRRRVLWQRRIARNAHRIIVPSKYLERLVIRWNVAPERIAVIYNGVDTDTPINEFQESIGFLESNKDNMIIVSIGRMVPWKGFEGLLTAFAEVKRQMSNATSTKLSLESELRGSFLRVEDSTSKGQMLLVGDGPEKENLEAKAQELGITDSITFTGKLSHDQILALLQLCDIFVLNSSYEGLSHQLLEACAAGAPIITTDAGGNPEVIRHEHNGLIVPVGNTHALANAIMRLVDDPSLRENLGQQARETAKQFPIEKPITNTIRLLEQTAPL